MEPEDREEKSLIFEQFPFFVGVNEKTQNVDEALESSLCKTFDISGIFKKHDISLVKL